MTYTIEHEGNRYGPDGIVPETYPSNEEVNRAEVAAWMSNPPDRYFVYVRPLPVPTGGGHYSRCEVTTWTGTVLGRGILGHPYRSNFGDMRRSIEFWGTNGRKYYGTFFCGAGDYARVRAAK